MERGATSSIADIELLADLETFQGQAPLEAPSSRIDETHSLRSPGLRNEVAPRIIA